MNTHELIKQAEQLLSKCSDGPWRVKRDEWGAHVLKENGYKIPDYDGDLPFIVFSRNHMPELIDIINQYRQLVKSLKINNECWCQVAIGNPTMKGHTEACKKAQALEDK